MVTMKRIRRFGLFAWTLLSSAWNQWRITGRVQWRVLPKIISVLRPSQAVDRRPGSMWWQRVRGCQRCPIYDSRRKACGHLGQTYQRGGDRLPLGCGCWIPGKAGLPDDDVGCWLWIETGGEAGVDWAKTVAKPSL